MMSQADITTSYRLFDSVDAGDSRDVVRRVVCFKCAYVKRGSDSAACPFCGFPLIVESGDDELCPDLLTIFDRTSVSVGAPPLPGVDPRPRKAQLVAEARHKRVVRSRELSAERRAQTERALSVRRRWSRLVFAFASAIAAGVVAATLV